MFSEPFPLVLSERSTIAGRCRELYAYMRWLKAVMVKSPGLKSLCLKTGYDVIKRGKMDAACDVIIAHSEQPDVAAAKLSALIDPAKMSAERQVRLPEQMAISVGLVDEAVCSRDGKDRDLCLAPVRFRKAYKARDVSRCGDSGLCLGMMEAKNADGPYLAELARLYCAGRSD